jgi:uncharacterized protein YjiS (DUF1127 family)
MAKLSQLITSLVWTARKRREVRIMASLDDRALADIGLLRSDVSSALEPWTRDPSRTLKTLCCQWRGAAVPQGCR